MKLLKISKKILPLLLLLFSLLLILFYSFRSVIVFDIDVARDLLLLNEIATKDHLTMIGSRTAINGVFHGPFWLYLNLPVFIAANGNPVYLGWFWLLLFLYLLVSIFYICIKFFNKKTGVMSVLIVASQGLFFIKSPTNPFMTVVLFPTYFYFFILYLRKSKFIHLIILLVLLGLLIQGEMVFGIPILFSSLILIARSILKSKKIRHFFILPILLLPLSTFFLFEIAHEGLQTNAIISYLTSRSSSLMNIMKIGSYFPLILQGARLFLAAPHDSHNTASIILNVFSFFSIVYLLFLTGKEKSEGKDFIVKTFLFLYGSFWLLLSFTHNTIHWYYYWSFIGIAAIFVASAAFKNLLVYIIVCVGVVFNLVNCVKYLDNQKLKGIVWSSQEKYANFIFRDAPQRFGYYVNTFDQINNYIPMSALNYEQRLFPKKQAIPFTKLDYTYVIIGPNPGGKPMDGSWWVKNRVHITSKPVKRHLFSSGYTVELYKPSKEEQDIPDESMFDSLQYR